MIPTSTSQVLDFAIKMFVETLFGPKLLLPHSNNAQNTILSPGNIVKRSSWTLKSPRSPRGSRDFDFANIFEPEMSKDQLIKFLSLFSEHIHSHKLRFITSADTCKWINTLDTLESGLCSQMQTVWRKLELEIDNGRFGLIRNIRGRYGFTHVSFQEHLCSLVWSDPTKYSLIRPAKKAIFKRKKPQFSAKKIAKVLLDPYFRETLLMCARKMQAEDFVKFLKGVLSKNHTTLKIVQSEMSVVHNILLQLIKRRPTEEQQSKLMQQLIGTISSTKVLEKLVFGLVHPSVILRTMAFKKIREPFVLRHYSDMIIDTLIEGIKNPKTYDSALASLKDITTEFVNLKNVVAYHRVIKQLMDMLLSYATFDALAADRAALALSAAISRSIDQSLEIKRYSGSAVILESIKDLLSKEDHDDMSIPYTTIESVLEGTRLQLMETIKSPLTSVRAYAIAVLGKIGSPSDVTLIRTLVSTVEFDDSSRVKAEAIRSLSNITNQKNTANMKQMDLITNFLMNKSSDIREKACRALYGAVISASKYEGAIDTLLKLLLDQVESVRAAAASSLLSLLSDFTPLLHQQVYQIFLASPSKETARVLAHVTKCSELKDTTQEELIGLFSTVAVNNQAVLYALMDIVSDEEEYNPELFSILLSALSRPDSIYREDDIALTCLIVQAIEKVVVCHSRYAKTQVMPVESILEQAVDELADVVRNTYMDRSAIVCVQAIESLHKIVIEAMESRNYTEQVSQVSQQIMNLLVESSNPLILKKCIEFVGSTTSALDNNNKKLIETVLLKTLGNSNTVNNDSLTQSICVTLAKISSVTTLINCLSLDHAKPFLFDHIVMYIRNSRKLDPDSFLIDEYVKIQLNDFKHIESYFILMELFAIN
jgi:HEAT repeat protein